VGEHWVSWSILNWGDDANIYPFGVQVPEVTAFKSSDHFRPGRTGCILLRHLHPFSLGATTDCSRVPTKHKGSYALHCQVSNQSALCQVEATPALLPFADAFASLLRRQHLQCDN
jgi:hypothetical protein